MKRYIVMTAKARMPSSCWGKYGKVAVVEREGDLIPKSIHPNHRAVRSIVEVWDRRNIGSTERCAFDRAVIEAIQLAAQLNEDAERLEHGETE